MLRVLKTNKLQIPLYLFDNICKYRKKKSYLIYTLFQISFNQWFNMYISICTLYLMYPLIDIIYNLVFQLINNIPNVKHKNYISYLFVNHCYCIWNYSWVLIDISNIKYIGYTILNLSFINHIYNYRSTSVHVHT